MKLVPEDERGQGRAALAVGLIVAIFIVGLIGSVLLPIAVDGLEEDRVVNQTQTTGVTESVNSQIDSTVTAATAGTDATVNLTVGNDTITNTISVGSTQTYSFAEGDVDVTVESTDGTDTELSYSIPSDFGYSSGAGAIWGILGLIIVLAAFLFIVSNALDVKEQI